MTSRERTAQSSPARHLIPASKAGASSGPPIPRSSASLAQRTASITTPALFGLSQTSILTSALSGTFPKVVPSIRM